MTTSNILVTGAAGYIGGSIVADFFASTNEQLSKARIHAAVRSQQQEDALSKLGINVLQLDLNDEKGVTESVLQHDINIIIHTASSIDPNLAKNLITALGKQKETSGRETYFIHTSALSAFYPRTGWPAEPFCDTDDVFGTEKRLADSYPVRMTDVEVIEYAKEVGVTSYVVVPSTVYGRGTGPWNQLSVVLPVYIAAALNQEAVYRFPNDVTVSAVHISDLTALYAIIVSRILFNDPPTSGEKGFYFALAHDITWYDIANHLATSLHSRNLADTKDVKIWSSDAEAAEAIGVPRAFVGPLWNSGGNIIAHNEERLGWKPRWTKEMFCERFGDEVDDVLELGKAKSSLIESLRKAASG